MNDIERQACIRVYQSIGVDMELPVFEVQYWNRFNQSISKIIDTIEEDYDVCIDRTAVMFDCIDLMFVSNAKASLQYSTCKRGTDKLYPSDLEA